MGWRVDYDKQVRGQIAQQLADGSLTQADLNVIDGKLMVKVVRVTPDHDYSKK